jgi:hypothetical protein
MAYRYTNTDKWSDAWFCGLDKEQKLLFMYLCDNCDCAGFIEVNKKKWAFECEMKLTEIEGALKGLDRGLTYSSSSDCIYLINFLKHQKNLPLNDCNKSHIGIFRRFDLYASRFLITDTHEFIENQMDRTSPSDNQEEKKPTKTKEKTWKTDYEMYLSELRAVYKELSNDTEWIKERERFNKNVDILLTLEKSCVEFWATESGWAHKKKGRSIENNWKSTLTKSISSKQNIVYKDRVMANSGSAIGKILQPETQEKKDNLLNKFKDAANK